MCKGGLKIVFLKKCLAFWTFAAFVIEVRVCTCTPGKWESCPEATSKATIDHSSSCAETPGTHASILYCLFLGLPPGPFFSI